MSAGCLVLVVGPSGVGKDTLLRCAGAALRDDGRFRFVRRVITRSGGDPHEDHLPLSCEEFVARESAGEFALAWRAHGLCYALPACIDTLLAEGRVVVANVSRGVVGQARDRFGRIGVIHVTASVQTRARRLAGRGRESRDERLRRLDRRVEDPAPGPDVRILVNDGPLDQSVGTMVTMLLAFAG